MKAYIKNFVVTALAVATVLGGYEFYNKKRVEKLMVAVNLSQGLASATRLKAEVSEYYFNNDKFPLSNTELKISEPKDFAGEFVDSIEIIEGGRILVIYSVKSGNEKDNILLIPEFDSKKSEISWRCISTNIERITSIFPTRQFNKDYVI